MDKFWMVSVEGTTSSQVRHTSKPSADAEVVRLARLNPGKKVFRLEAMVYCEVKTAPVEWTALY